jgi:hypothetical protein
VATGTVVTRRPDVRSRVRRPTPLPVEMETVVTNRPHVRSRFRQTGEPPVDLGTFLSRIPYAWGPVRVPAQFMHAKRPLRLHEGSRKRHPLNDHPLRIELDVIVL